MEDTRTSLKELETRLQGIIGSDAPEKEGVNRERSLVFNQAELVILERLVSTAIEMPVSIAPSQIIEEFWRGLRDQLNVAKTVLEKHGGKNSGLINILSLVISLISILLN